MGIREILKQRLVDLLNQKDAIIQELNDFEELLANGVYEGLIKEIMDNS